MMCPQRALGCRTRDAASAWLGRSHRAVPGRVDFQWFIMLDLQKAHITKRRSQAGHVRTSYDFQNFAILGHRFGSSGVPYFGPLAGDRGVALGTGIHKHW